MPPNDGTDISEEEKKKKINEDVVEFLRKRSETEAPRYIARLKTYVNLQKKRRKASAARRHSEQILQNERSSVRKSAEQKSLESTDKAGNGTEDRTMKRRGGERQASRMGSRAASQEPMDRCGGRRRRRRSGCRRKRRRRSGCRKKRRRRSGCRKKRRRRSCSRRRKRRRRRSCSRRRRRRSCRRRRKKCRRKRRRC